MARWNGLEILIPKHMRKSKIRPPELIKDKKPRKYLFLETPCTSLWQMKLPRQHYFWASSGWRGAENGCFHGKLSPGPPAPSRVDSCTQKSDAECRGSEIFSSQPFAHPCLQLDLSREEVMDFSLSGYLQFWVGAEQLLGGWCESRWVGAIFSGGWQVVSSDQLRTVSSEYWQTGHQDILI